MRLNIKPMSVNQAWKLKTKIMRTKIKYFIYKIFAYCPNHGWFNRMEKYRMNTAYVQDELNYSYGCKQCQKECFEYYQELWDDYYSSRF